MRTVTAIAVGLFSVVILSCASSQAVRPPDAPEELRPPADQVLALETRATGVQIYECSAGKDQPERFEWVFQSPEAELFDRAGRKVGKHYAGPTWESTGRPGTGARRFVVKISLSRSMGIASTVWPLPVTVVALRSEL